MPPIPAIIAGRRHHRPVVTKTWSYATGDNSGDSSPVVANGIVYIGSANYNFYALNTMTGAVVWTNTSNYDIQSTAVANGTVYFTSVSVTYMP